MAKQRTAQQNDSTRVLANHFERYQLVERFDQTPGINADLASGTEATRVPRNRHFEVLGTNGTSALATFADGGGVTATTDTGANDQMIILPHLDTKQTAWAATKWNTNDEVAFSTKVEIGATITSMIVWAGLKLTNTSTTATDDDQVFFRYEDGVNGGRWQCIGSNAGTDESLDSGVTVAASDSYELEIDIDHLRVPRFYINGDHVATGSALASNIDLIPYLGVETTTTAARAATWRGLVLAKDMND